MQKITVLEDEEVITQSLASEEGRKVTRLALPAVLKKWKVRAAKKIRKGKFPLVTDAERDYMKKLLHRAAYVVVFRAENQKGRQKLKSPVISNYCNAKEFEVMFPPS